MRTLVFCLCAAGGFLACHAAASLLMPPVCVPPPPRPPQPGWYLGNHGDLGLDYYVLRFGLLDTAEHLRAADMLCISSSKGMFGYDVALLSEKLSRPGRPFRVYNLSFGYGESFHYPMEVIKALDLRDKVLVADLTDNTLDYHLSPMAQMALRCVDRTEATKFLWEKWLSYERDRLLTRFVPKVVYTRDKGFGVSPYLTSAQFYRDTGNGNLAEVPARNPHWARVATYPDFYRFRYDDLREPFFEECRRRNIRIIFTSIPYEGYDPKWGQEIARKLGFPYAGVADDGIELFDPYHMSARGRAVFSRRLADRLAAAEFGIVDQSLAP